MPGHLRLPSGATLVPAKALPSLFVLTFAVHVAGVDGACSLFRRP